MRTTLSGPFEERVKALSANILRTIRIQAIKEVSTRAIDVLLGEQAMSHLLRPSQCIDQRSQQIVERFVDKIKLNEL